MLPFQGEWDDGIVTHRVAVGWNIMPLQGNFLIIKIFVIHN
jgi:hypothetical protein